MLKELDFLPHGYTVKLTDASQENPLKIAAKLQQRKEIVTAETDLSFQISLKHIPMDTLYREQWHLNNRGDGVGLVAGADVKAERAWDYTRGSRDIVVCVMDDGFDLGHPDFNVPGKIVSPRDFGQEDFDPNPVFEDDNHGTACAGVSVAEENGTEVVGLAPGCAFMPVRTSPWLSDESIVSLFQYAIDKNADVISCSWSAAAWNFPRSTKMDGIIHKAATEGRRNKKGCVILFAAGNEDRLPEVLFVEHRVSKPIPDLGVSEDDITFPLEVTVKEIEVTPDIKHTYRGDLRVILKPPQGSEIMFHDGSGGSQKDLIRSFRSSDEPGLFASVIGTSAKGNWRLKVMDMAKQDVGNLNKWGVAITYT